MSNVSLIDGHLDNTELCVCCGKEIPEGRQYCVICGYKAKHKKINYDRMRNMSIDEMATTIAAVADLCRNPEIYGYSTNPVFVKRWLESEVME